MQAAVDKLRETTGMDDAKQGHLNQTTVAALVQAMNEGLFTAFYFIAGKPELINVTQWNFTRDAFEMR